MKFLCLPGAFGNIKTFRVQLAPICSQLESDSTASFCFTQGSVEAIPPPGFENYFGSGPYFRFTPLEKSLEGALSDVVRSLVQRESPEETMRAAVKKLQDFVTPQVSRVIEDLRRTMDEEGDVEGIIGYSEGAMMAASFLFDEQRRCKERGIEQKIKCAMFIAGWPPIDSRHDQVVLSDETEDTIKIPTCHVMSALDPMIHGPMALYNLCDQDQAEVFDHGYGHLVPREERTVKELSQVVRNMISSVKVA